MKKTQGIDVSHWQGDIDWFKVAEDNVEFAFVKASEGKTFKDPLFTRNVLEAKQAKIKIGAYHYAKFSTDSEAKKEAEHFIRTVSNHSFDYPLVLDLEENKKKVSAKQLTNAAITFLEEINKAGYTPMLYTYKSFLENQLVEDDLKMYPLWVTRYNQTLGRSADIWQYSDQGKINGIKGKVDLNWSYRDFSIIHESIDKVNTTTYTVLKEVPAYKNSLDAKNKINRVLFVKPDTYYIFNKKFGMVNVSKDIGIPRSWINPHDNETEYYIVQDGDTLIAIAKKYTINLTTILKLNPDIKNPNLIYPKQTIRIK